MTTHGFFRNLLLAGFTIATCFPQTGVPFPLPLLKEFLSLTNDQITRLIQIQSDYYDFIQGKNERVTQVDQEITRETNRAVLDSNALGVRYLELEVICREAKGARATLAKSNLALLTDAQKLKLNQLEAAMNLGDTIYEAQYINLLPGGNPNSNPSLNLIQRILTAPSNYFYAFPGCLFSSLQPEQTDGTSGNSSIPSINKPRINLPKRW